MSTLRRSTGTIISSTLQDDTCRQIVKKGDAAATAGQAAGTYLDITLVSVAKDTAYLAATSNAPIVLGVDDILLKPLAYPEPAGL